MADKQPGCPGNAIRVFDKSSIFLHREKIPSGMAIDIQRPLYLLVSGTIQHLFELLKMFDRIFIRTSGKKSYLKLVAAQRIEKFFLCSGISRPPHFYPIISCLF